MRKNDLYKQKNMSKQFFFLKFIACEVFGQVPFRNIKEVVWHYSQAGDVKAKQVANKPAGKHKGPTATETGILETGSIEPAVADDGGCTGDRTRARA